jgi:hypothetical protein
MIGIGQGKTKISISPPRSDLPAVAMLLKNVDDIADPVYLEIWRNTRNRFGPERDIAKASVSGRDQAGFEPPEVIWMVLQ